MKFTHYLTGILALSSAALIADELKEYKNATEGAAQSILNTEDTQKTFKKPSDNIASTEQQIAATPLEGIKIVSGNFQGAASQDISVEKGVHVDTSIDIPDQQAFSALLTSFIGQPLSQDKASDIADAVRTYFKDHHRALTAVVVSSIDEKQGTMSITIVQGILEKVTVEGNKWNSSRRIKRMSGLKEGEVIDTDDLRENLLWMNNQFRNVNVEFAPGSKTGLTDATLITNDRIPIRPYVGGDNTGIPSLGYTRWFAGVDVGNIFGNQSLNYQFTTGNSAYRFIAHSGNYIIPFPWKHRLLTYGGYSRAHAKVPTSFKHKGIFWQVDFRYQAPLSRLYANLFHQISGGYDFKRTNSNIFFGGAVASGSTADINQFAVQYDMIYTQSDASTSLTVELYAAPFRMTADQSNSNYNAIRPYAKAKYAYGKAKVTHLHNLPKQFTLQFIGAFQGTGWNLLPSEQYALGGHNTVRGYNEDSYLADDAILGSVEIRSPGLPLFGAKKRFGERLEFLVFLDSAWGIQHKAPPGGERSNDYLIGIGPGLRYSIKENVTFRCDLGFPTHKVYGSGLYPHVHVGGTLSY